MSKMLRNYQYLVDPSTRKYPGDDLNEFVTGAVTTAVTNLVGLAPEDLDTLGELASAMQNNPDFLTTLQGHDADLLAAVGIAAGDQNIGAMATPELPDSETVKALFEAIGEAARRLREGLGVAQGESDLGTFTGSTIADASSVKSALQAVETAHEAEVSRATGSESDLGGRIDALGADVDQNEADSDAAEAALSLRLDALELDPTTQAAVDAVQADVDQNETDADAAIAVERGRIDAILAGVDADKDTFAEIVSLINSVDTTNDNAFAAYVLSNDAAVAAVQADVDQNELDSDAADTALGGRIDAVEAEIDTARTNIYTAIGQTEGAQAMGTFTGSTLGDGQTIKQLLQSLETATEGEITARTAIAEFASNLTKLKNDVRGTYINVGNNIEIRPAPGGRVEIVGDLYLDNNTAIDGSGTTLTSFANINAYDGRITTVAADLATEENARLSGDASEASARQTADNTLQANIDAVQADVDQNESDADAAIALKLDASAVSAFGLTLVDDADAATARTTLGLDASTLRSILGITENAGDPADGRGMYYDTSASKYLLSS
jgi:hypothetical protein